MQINEDKRIVMTLDAGGTNFVFSAIQAGKEIVSPVHKAATPDDRDKSLEMIKKGFQEVKDQLKEAPVAISFAFPGPANYPAGIIDNVGNLPAFAGGVALGPMLEAHFRIPVFINNDGDLFAYGEAMAGFLPEVNARLKAQGIAKQYHNLLGVTIGTGFGGGIILHGKLLEGDNSSSGEVWLLRNMEEPALTAEEGVSIRAVQYFYEIFSETNEEVNPEDIFHIAKGTRQGDQKAALKAYEKMGSILGEALANALTLIDGAVVIGGGLSAAHELFFPKMLEKLNGTISSRDNRHFSRLVSQVYNLEDAKMAEAFFQFEQKEIAVPDTDKKVAYNPERRLPLGISKLGTNQATALGAYAFALNQL